MTKKTEKQFDEIKDKLFVIEQNGSIYKLDFDNKERGISAGSQHPSQPPTKKSEKDMTKKKELSEDLTKKQVRENYYHETKETKLDGSAMMMETRIAKCVEAGGTFEECSKQVKAEMKKKGSDITNTEDIADEEKEEVEDEEKEETEEETDMEILKKEKEELLKEKEQMETDMISMKKQFEDWGKTMEKITEERTIEQAEKRQIKIKKLSKDFQLPEEDLKEESLKEILEDPSHDKVLDFIETILDKAGKKVKEEEAPEATVDFTEYLNNAEKEHKKLMAHYDLRRSPE